jgi:hypothetical protein
MVPIRHAARTLAANAARIAIVCVLALPLLVTLRADPAASAELRQLAPAPALPGRWRQRLAGPAAADAWINDHFGWRAQMVAAYARLRHDLFGRFPTSQVIAGREGRVFLSAHSKQAEPYSAIQLSCGWGFKDRAGIVAEVNWLAHVLQARGIDGRLLIVPSAPAMYSEQLPTWQSERCRPANSPGYQVLAAPALEPAARALVYFPLDEMRAMRARVQFIPLTFFHWMGSGSQAVAAMTEEHFWHRRKDFGKPIPLVARRKPSDIQWMFPGIEHDSIADEPDYSGTGITACLGADCFPGLKPVMAKLDTAARYTNSAPGLAGRLVMVSDSFGYAAGQAFARYHSEVVQVSTNMLSRLDRDELAALRELLLRPGSGDQVLFLYHDASMYSDRVRDDMKLLKP